VLLFTRARFATTGFTAGVGVTGGASTFWLWATLIVAALLGLAFWGSYVPVVMSPPREQHILPAHEADNILNNEDQVLGLVWGKHARAYPRRLIARPT